MASPIINATGWAELMQGNLIGASFTLYNTAFIGWFVPLLFFIYQIILFIKTRNLLLNFITGLFFISMYGLTYFTHAKMSLVITFLILVFELAGILYFILWK